MTISAKISRQVGTQARSSEISSHPHSDIAVNCYVMKQQTELLYFERLS